MLTVDNLIDHLDITLPDGNKVSVWKLCPIKGAKFYSKYDCGIISQLQFKPSENELKKDKLDWIGYSDVISKEYKFRVIACEDTVMKYYLYWVQ